MTEQGEKRLFSPVDMEKLRYVSAPTVSPDGAEVVFVKYRADAETGLYYSNLYRVATSGGEAVRVTTSDDDREDRPAFSPDGKWLAYVAPGANEPQVWLIDLSEERRLPTQLTTMRHGVNGFVWSPDSRSIAFETKIWPGESDADLMQEMSADEHERRRWDAENMPFATEELMYKFDETFGVVDGSVRQIGIIDVATGSGRLLTDGKNHADTPAWSQDSARVAYYQYIYTHHEAKRCELFVTEVASEVTVQVTDHKRYISPSPPVFTADDGKLLFVTLLPPETSEETSGASPVTGFGPFFPELVAVPVGGGDLERLFPTEEVCHGVGAGCVGRTEYGTKNADYQQCGDEIYFVSSWHGETHVYRLNADGAPPRIAQVTRGAISVRTFCAPVDNKLIYTRSDLESTDDVYCLDLNTGKERRLTHSNDWLNDVTTVVAEEMWVPSQDGKAQIHGWVVPPAIVEPGQTYPVVLYIHGGPQVSWTSAWWHEFQALAAKGIGVVYCDPRGSTGFGREFVADGPAWGEEAMDDLLAFVDAAIAKYPYLDGDRIGVTGGSYGGYMTVKLLGQRSGRFQAGVAQRVFCNPATSYGTGDMGFVSAAPTKPRSFKAYIENRARRSLLTAIDNMKTPLLILHGIDDYRCTVEQAEQLFVAMKDRNPEIPVRMVLFPGENHDLTRTGRIKSQIRHVSEMVSWFEQHLSKEAGGSASDRTGEAAAAS